MIRVIEETQQYDGTRYVEIACTSSDDKPTEGIAQGSICLEQSGSALNVYMFNEEDGSWIEIGGSSGDDSLSPTPSSTPA